MKVKASQISQVLGGELVGNPDVEVFKPCKIEEGQQGGITFLANPKYKSYIYSTQASVVIVSSDFVAEQPLHTTIIKVQDPYLAFSQLLDFYKQLKMSEKQGIEQPVSIAETAQIGEGAYIGAFVKIGENTVIGKNVKIYPNSTIGDGVQIGDNTFIFSGVTVYDDCQIGENCILHAGVVIGADGFGFAPQQSGEYKKVPQIGNVLIENDVEIGANTTIDRATLGSTIIRKGAKLDNLVQIAHNVEVGECTVIASQSGVAGSTKIGSHCVIGGQVGIAGHLTIGNQVKIQAQSGVGRNVKDKEVLQGTPALGYAEYNRAYVVFRKLPQLYKKIENIIKK